MPEGYPLNADDRKVLDDIKAVVAEDLKITRALSVSLIGKSNGDTVDEAGGRMGRLERTVAELQKFRTWALTSIITALVGAIVWLLDQIVKAHK